MSKEKKQKYISTAKIILKIIAGAGLLSVAILAPNVIQTLDMFRGKDEKWHKYGVSDAIERLKKRKFIEIKKNKKGIKIVSLTNKGKQELLKYQLEDLVIKRPKKWDRKWRVVIFDIKEKRRKTRDQIRKTLNILGFVKLQNSVWVFPYDCEDLIILLKSNNKIGKDVLYMKVEKIENDWWLKKLFKLS